MSSRLDEIKLFSKSHYSHIWDTCCDHGKLGLLYLEDSNIETIHFVDTVPSIIKKLDQKILKRSLTRQQKMKTFCMSAADIKLSDQNKSLVFICGVGGETAIEITNGLLKNNRNIDFDIIFCVQYRTVDLRMFLKENGFFSQRELLYFEGKWAHEIIFVNKKEGEDIDCVGRNLYDKSNSKHLNHLKKLITHFENKSKNDKRAVLIKEMYSLI